MTKRLARKKPAGRGSNLRARLLRELRGGPAGVRLWNARPLEQREAAGGFRGIDLAGADLSGADLGSLDFRGARLGGAALAGAWLRRCNLAGADLKAADLTKAWCAGARFRAADLEGALLAGANLTACDFRKATLRGADLTGAALDGADLCGADLASAKLQGATFRRAKLDEATRWPAGADRPDDVRWAGGGEPPLDFDAFMKRLEANVDVRRLGRAMEMLRFGSFKLFARVEDDALVGVVKSQREAGLVYSCRLDCDGRFACCSQDLRPCLGMRGALCKHLMVLVVGLTRSGELAPAVADRWVRASKKARSAGEITDPDRMSETLLRYKGAEADRIDWRPVETIPEDYYAY